MKTDLNDSVISFFSKCRLEFITKENIKKYFQNINSENDYGGILHACVHNKFDEEKVLKLMEILMELGIDVNLQGKLTGYTFIHLALYGYTENDKDYSYSTDFILKLIRLAKEHGFNVNIVDNDKDTIIHTAIASEVYNGKIEPLNDELGIDFKIDAKDNNGNDIYQALLKYKEEAIRTNNKIWLTKLQNEEQIIKNRIELSRYNLDDLKNKIKEQEEKLNKIYENLDINMIFTNSDNIKKIIYELEQYIKIVKDVFNETITTNIFNEINIKIKDIINNYIIDLFNNPNSTKISELENILKKLPILNVELDKFNKLKNQYLENIEKIRQNINDSKTLNKLLETKKDISKFNDQIIKDELDILLSENEKKYTDEINSINELTSLINITNNWLRNNIEENNQNDLNDLTIDKLKKIKEDKCNYLKKLKEQVINSVTLSINNIINSTNTLSENKIITETEISDCVLKTLNKNMRTK